MATHDARSDGGPKVDGPWREPTYRGVIGYQTVKFA